MPPSPLLLEVPPPALIVGRIKLISTRCRMGVAYTTSPCVLPGITLKRRGKSAQPTCSKVWKHIDMLESANCQFKPTT